MANMTFGVNILPKANANVTIGNSDNPWTIVGPVITESINMGRKANTTVGTKSVALGNSVTASGQTSFAEGNFTTASGSCSHAEGQVTTASGIDAHAEGSSTTASGEHSHAENFSSNAYGKGSHAEGYATAADGSYCHVSGIYNARDLYSNYPTWTANHSYAVGDKVKRTVDSAYRLFVCIEANSDATFTDAHWQDTDGVLTYAEIIGNGTANNARSNARALDWDGNEYLKGDVYVGCNADSTGGTKLATVSQIPGTMTGATSSAAGASGLVPAPSAGDDAKFLRGDGTWETVSSSTPSKVTFSIATTDWTLSSGSYVAEISNSNFTAASEETVYYDSSVLNLKSGMLFDKDGTSHNAVFATDIIPSGTISGYIISVDSGVVYVAEGADF